MICRGMYLGCCLQQAFCTPPIEAAPGQPFKPRFTFNCSWRAVISDVILVSYYSRGAPATVWGKRLLV
eukprot:2482390-Amphidinium_carterae.1